MRRAYKILYKKYIKRNKIHVLYNIGKGYPGRGGISMVIRKITIFYPHPKEFVVGKGGVKNISIKEEDRVVLIAYENGDKRKIIGLPYEVMYSNNHFSEI